MSEESKPKQPEPNNRLPFFLLSGLVLVFLFFTLDVFKSQPVEISYSEFLQELGMGKIKDVNIVNMREITGVRYDESNRATGFRAIIPYFDESLLVRLEKVMSASAVRLKIFTGWLDSSVFAYGYTCRIFHLVISQYE